MMGAENTNKANKIKDIFFNFTTRKNEAFSLLALIAITTTPIYLLMGIYASGHVPFLFHKIFWYIDWILWIPRSIVEVRIIFYILSSITEDNKKNTLLLIIDGVLIFLMGIIFWPIVLSMQYQEPLKDVLPHSYILITAWSLLVALNVPLMAGSLAIAYKIQPETQNNKLDLEKLRIIYNDLLTKNEELSEIVDGINYNQREFGRALRSEDISLDKTRTIAGKLYTGKISQVIAGYNEG